MLYHDISGSILTLRWVGTHKENGNCNNNKKYVERSYTIHNNNKQVMCIRYSFNEMNKVSARGAIDNI